jgi:DNA-binding GntR family transcriptional regulator
MSVKGVRMDDTLRFRALETSRTPAVTDQVYDAIYDQVVTVELPPGTRISEADVARALGVSRQPVRDAFWRLSKLGFLTIRPQRATTVSPISEAAVLQARFVRTALEVETVRIAAATLGPADHARLAALLDAQAAAVAEHDRERFHGLDDEFHRLICELSGHGFAWALIREHKAHMDRVRFLSLAFGAEAALADHRVIVEALVAHDEEAAIAAMRIHLGRIAEIMDRVRAEGGVPFAGDA